VYDAAIDEIRKFDWTKILNKANSLAAFNTGAWRFTKAKIIELTVEKYSNGNLVYVDQKHKDFDWPSMNFSVELKSVTSLRMYTKTGKMKKSYEILLNNSMGTNKKELDISEISDLLIAVYSDGAYVINKEIVMKYLKRNGDGFRVYVPKSEIIPVVDRAYKFVEDTSVASLQKDILTLIKEKI
jgi:hypothetical protein